jgi:ribosome-interacting GTPase 1
LRICLDFLESRNLLIDDRTPAADGRGNVLGKKAVCLCTKCDIANPGALETLKEFCKHSFEFVEISVQTAEGLDKLPALFFHSLGIIRIYAKPPGKKPDMAEPFTLPAGSTVSDLAAAIHRELADKLKFAKIWGTDVYQGQNVQKNHVLCDKDIIELHFA